MRGDVPRVAVIGRVGGEVVDERLHAQHYVSDAVVRLSVSRQSRDFGENIGLTMDKKQRLFEVFRAGRWFSHLPAPLQDQLLAAGVERRLGKNEVLFSRGDAPSGLFGVVDGAIRITAPTSATSASARDTLLALLEAPMWFGEIAVFDGKPRTHDAIAAEPSTLLHVPDPALQAILAQEPRYWRDLGLLVTNRLRLVFTALEDVVVLPLGVRLARRLVWAAERYGEWHDRSSRVLDLKQEQLAAMLSASRQSVNQVLKDLEARGLVKLAYGTIEIVDLEGLRKAGTPA
jgi:CRP-like cAMP-binding protein